MTGLSVPCPSVVRVDITAQVTHLCPFKTEVDHGTVTVSWTTAFGETLELHALAELLRRHAQTEISHEQWTADVADAITAGAKVDALSVTSRWQTSGLDVECSVHPDGGESDG